MTVLGVTLTPTMMLVIAAIGLVMLVVGLVKKIKFIIKLGIVIAAVGFVMNGGLMMLTSYF